MKIPTTKKTELKRSLSMPLLTFYGLGNILGAGIYVLIGKVGGHAGMYAPIAFMIAALVAGFSAFTYGELSARYPLSAGEAVYIEEAFHFKSLSRLIGLLIAFGGMVSAATISHGFYGYTQQFLDWPQWLIIVSLVLTLGLLALWGISQSVTAAAALTLIEIVGLLMVIWAGRGALAEIPMRSGELIPSLAPGAWTGILLGAFLSFFAFIGFEDMVNVAEEVKNPHRTLPTAILLALFTATLLYGLVSLVAVLTVRSDMLAVSQAPLTLIYSTASGKDPFLISLIGIFAVVNGALIQIIMASRIFYGMARKGWLWKRFADIGSKTRTPTWATWAVTIIIMILALWFPVEKLAAATSFSVLIVFASVNAALIVIKSKNPIEKGLPSHPMWIPVLGLITSLGLLFSQVVVG